ncbi:hypothetical protein [uncultured Maritimibacter sp.]|jgi:hypothetical protein|uniref:hypothetical protein n=1 Tax=uncultured Maritimibacter sp. TaxID=991866 RepID=UPI00262CD959|nr:hypothetical protein [uncultured Maritimibacter sp.]
MIRFKLANTTSASRDPARTSIRTLVKTRLNAATAIGATGVLAGLCVAAWGSFFAVHGLYPSYVEAFHGGKTETRTVAKDVPPAVTTPSEANIVAVADMPVKTEVPVTEVLETPAKVQDEPSPQDFAAMGRATAGAGGVNGRLAPGTDADVKTAAADSMTFVAPSSMDTDSDPLAGIDPELLAGRMGSQPLEGDDLVTRVVASATNVVNAIRPQPRPASFAPTTRGTETGPTDEPGEIMSSMSGASELAVPLSPRPRAVPEDLRQAFATPGAVARVESVAANPVEPSPRGNAVLTGNSCNRSLAGAMPGRRGNAAGGQTFVASLGNGSGGSRDNAIINELARGNMPDFLHDLQPVVLSGKDSRGASTQIVICVTPDYLAVGSDRDFVRVPMGLPAAASIAAKFNMTLPTSRMVDAIYAQSTVRLSPSPMQAGPQMSSTDYFLRHNATIEGQRGGRTGLVSGHKKDVVLANRMESNPGRVAIYGWHRSKNDPIQPVSTVHGASYADYSHGIRLVSRTAYVNGKPVDIDDLLSSDRYAYLLNADGPMPGRVIQIASR